ncbi:MAG TPA: PTS glucose transporter subunit IIA [Bacillota bacterium]|nr:PTS glucose transporter subunit IIA [Bacillota bacterium]HPF42162.1 PTS glucose transporter subunit IIA [Bacillota bacterium]HPJ85667.1 PTS glucose transporter subunit IIA [Bacillota bacterium]HPQ61696.1 PTS glucose transporter subunit IIA [Bacillota bacterium]
MLNFLHAEKKTKEHEKCFVYSPVKGHVFPIEEISDEAFSKHMLGDGFAVNPVSNQIVSPVNGKITAVFPTNHAIAITAENGTEILIHIGIDTVNLNGSFFHSLARMKQKVVVGMPLIMVEFAKIAEKGYEIPVIVVVTNLNEGYKIQKNIDAFDNEPVLEIERGE